MERPQGVDSGFWQRDHTEVLVLFIVFFLLARFFFLSFFNEQVSPSKYKKQRKAGVVGAALGDVGLMADPYRHPLPPVPPPPAQGLHDRDPASPPLPPLGRGLWEQHVCLR